MVPIGNALSCLASDAERRQEKGASDAETRRRAHPLAQP